MRALVFTNQLELRDDYPTSPAVAGESLVAVTLAGICGTDLEITRGYMGYRGVPGHEFVGRVIESANPALVGCRVVGEINAACGQCDYCRRELGRHCPRRTVLGILGRDGAFAELLRLPDANLVTVPDSVPDEMAVFTEPLAAAYEILAQVNLRRNQPILVLGDGRLGSLVALTLRAESFEVALAGHHPERLAERLAWRFAARPAALQELKVTLEDEVEPGWPVVVDCTGNSAGFRRAVELVAPRGLIVLKSTAAAAAALNLAPLVINEVTVVGSRCGRFAPALAALAEGRIDPRPLIDGVYPLADGLAAFAAAADQANLKILVRPA